MSANKGVKPLALITGASSGLGAAFAGRLAQDGYDLTIVARRRDRLESLAEQLQTKHHANVEVISADLSRPDELLTVEKHIADGNPLELLINNAGFGGYMPFVELDPDKAAELINLKVMAVTRLTRAALPGMLARGRGSIVNVSSRLAFSAPLGSTQLPKRAVSLQVAGHSLTLRGHAAVVDGELRPLAPAPMAVLRALATSPGRVLSRATLLQALPRGADEHAVEMAVARLRAGLAAPGVVQTVVKRCYRLPD